MANAKSKAVTAIMTVFESSSPLFTFYLASALVNIDIEYCTAIQNKKEVEIVIVGIPCQT